MLPSTILTVLVIQSVGTRRLLNHAVMAYKRNYGGRFGWPTYFRRYISPTLPTPATFVSNMILHHAVTLQLTVAVARLRNTQITQRTKSS